MGHHDKSTWRIFVIGVLMIVTTSMLMSILTDDCFHWVAASAAILVLYRVARGGGR